jgi:hypothetical protein
LLAVGDNGCECELAEFRVPIVQALPININCRRPPAKCGLRLADFKRSWKLGNFASFASFCVTENVKRSAAGACMKSGDEGIVEPAGVFKDAITATAV